MEENSFELNLEELIQINNHSVFERINIFIKKPFHLFNFHKLKPILDQSIDNEPDFAKCFFQFLKENNIFPETLKLIEGETNVKSKSFLKNNFQMLQ
jgi:hypothetical protein